MSRAAATVAGRARSPQRTAPAPPRRVSGPVRPKAVAVPGAVPRPSALPRPRTRVAADGAQLVGRRLIGLAGNASTSWWMDRLVRSRGWVVIVAIALMGIVAMQVSLLQMNTGVSRAVESAATLERTNSALRSEVSRLGSGERIQQVARDRGLAMPAPSHVSYLRAGELRADGARAARSMRVPDRNAQAPIAAAGAGAPAIEPVPEPVTPAEQAAPAPAETAAAAPTPAPAPAPPAEPVPAPTPEPAAAPGAATSTGAVAAP